MPRFHFNLSDGKRFTDPEGVELENIAAARVYAASYLGDVIRDDPAEPWTGGEMEVEVADDRGLTLCTVTVVCQDAPAALRIVRYTAPSLYPPCCRASRDARELRRAHVTRFGGNTFRVEGEVIPPVLILDSEPISR